MSLSEAEVLDDGSCGQSAAGVSPGRDDPRVALWRLEESLVDAGALKMADSSCLVEPLADWSA